MKRYLKEDAVPSLNLPVRSCDRPTAPSESATRRAERIQRRERVDHHHEENVEDGEDGEEQCGDVMDELQDILKRDIGVQVSVTAMASGRVNIFSLLDSDQKLCVMTGIPSFDVLSSLEKLVQVELPATRDVERGIVVTMMRLKTGLSFTCLGVLLGTDRSTCSRHFSTILPVLAGIMNSMAHKM